MACAGSNAGDDLPAKSREVKSRNNFLDTFVEPF